MSVKKTTIKDVAKKSGFSPTTVSRVLNENYPVKAETREKILEAVHDLKFNRNTTARNLRLKKSGLMALVVADINNTYYSRIAKRVGDGLFDEGYNLLVCNTNEIVEKENKILSMLANKGVDVIAVASSTTDPSFIESLVDLGGKIVLLDRDMNIEGVPFVGSDNFESSKRLTEYVLQKGHTRVAFVSGPENVVTSQDRMRGYQAALLENGLELNEYNIVSGQFKKEEAFNAIKKFLLSNRESSDPYTAIVSSNNVMTAGVIAAVNSIGLKIPGDISLVSFGSLDMQEIISPQVTCIDQNEAELAKTTLETMLKLSKEEHSEYVESTIIQDSFIEGGSVANLKKILG